MEKGAIIVEITNYVRLQAMREALVRDVTLRTGKNVEDALALAKTFATWDYMKEPKAEFEISCIREWMKRAKDSTTVYIRQENWHESDEYNSIKERIQVKNSRVNTPFTAEEFDAIFEEERVKANMEWGLK